MIALGRPPDRRHRGDKRFARPSSTASRNAFPKRQGPHRCARTPADQLVPIGGPSISRSSCSSDAASNRLAVGDAFGAFAGRVPGSFGELAFAFGLERGSVL